MTTSPIPPKQPIGQLNRPLAIVGMSCRLPGADGLDEFWRLLQTGTSAIERMPDSKLNRDLYFDPVKGRRGKTYSEIGGCISERELDWSILPLDRSEIGKWDPCHLILCETAAAACVDAGWDPHNLPLRKGAVFVGHSGGSTLGGEIAYRTLVSEQVELLSSIPGFLNSVADLEELKAALLYRLQSSRPERDESGNPLVDAGFASALISRALGLTGAHMSIDAACASSLVALALGAASLQTGQSDFAIVGGASFNKSDSMILFSNAQSCSASGSRPFDEAADGLISSEGYVAIVLRTLERALADGDRVHAVVRGIGISSDGRGKSLWAPRKEGQYTAIRRAYSDEVTPSSVSMIEAHATSTQVGDATEMEALSQFFSEHCKPGQRIPVGSVKSNIGHTLETAGLAGVVKSVLSIQHATIPPSVNVKNLNRSIKWDAIPLYVATQCAPWPALDENVPRRAAINAFGIGGLNVHVVVEQFLATQLLATQPSRQQTIHSTAPHSTSTSNAHYEPIAVIGRGVVIPGASNVDQLQNLLHSRASQIGTPPADRFGCDANLASAVQGGFVRGFEYDWRKHKVPPKQIAQANPLQFMLLEAAEQALRESLCFEREFDRQNTAVVVGSIFGGDFGNALFSGLRLPEFKHHLRLLLIERGLAADTALALTETYETNFLKFCPALLDETGSFTSSTLASRLSKTFDLMGGAMAIDSGDVSSFAALQAASQLLVTRTVNQVLCAAAHRALDVAAMNALARLGRLRNSHQIPSDREGYFVGEGVAVVMLKRLSDAERDGDKVLAVIDGIAPGFDANSLRRSVSLASERLSASAPIKQIVGGIGIDSVDTQVENALNASSLRMDPVQQPLSRSVIIPLTGHLQAAQGLTDLIAATLDKSLQVENAEAVLASHTFSGQSYVVSVRPHVAQPKETTIVKTPVAPLPAINKKNLVDCRIWRLAASSLSELQKQVVQLSDSSMEQIRFSAATKFNSDHLWRAAIVCDESSIVGKLKLMAAQLGNATSRLPLAEQGLFWSKPEERTERVAWLFPGQGSQYHGMFDSFVATEPAASRALAAANSILSKHGHPTFDKLAWCQTESLGENVWHTQAAMLVADWVMLECLRDRGYHPTLVSGHSYGEFAAMLAAGCWDFENALLATWYRCQSIVKNVPTGCSMLSIHASREKVEQLIHEEALPLYVSHVNAPEQIVVGGKQAAIAHLSELLDDEGIGTRILAVPTAFHTPALQPAQAAFRSGLAAINIQPPRLPLLSSITVRYEADPPQIVHNLVDQLVHPVDFVALCQRLRHDNIGLILEVGPQQVLSRLVRQNLGDSVQVVSTDHSKRGAQYQLLCAEANIDLFCGNARKDRLVAPQSSQVSTSGPQATAAPVHFDATQARRERMRQLGRSQTKSLAEEPAVSHVTSAPTTTATTQVPTTQVPGYQVTPHPIEAAAHPATSHTTPSHPVLPSQPRSMPSVATQPLQPTQTGVVAPTKNATDRIAAFLIDFVVEQTGYPAEIIELDWDIEADLGIDSIKKAQLFGELREFFDLESLKNFSLDHYKTLRDIAKLLEQTPGKGEWLQVEEQSPATFTSPADSRAAAPQVKPVESPAVQSADQSAVHAAVQTAASVSSVVHESRPALAPQQLQQFLIDFVVEQTGYPAEIVELDADLEADLGIDSIKKAQLFGELREMFSFSGRDGQSQNVAGGRQSLADYRTLRDVMDALLQSQSTTIVAEPAQSEAAGPPVMEASGSVEFETSRNAEQAIVPAQPFHAKLACSATQSSSKQEWPVAGLKHPAARTTVGEIVLTTNWAYREALASNLRAMVGRKDASKTAVKQNGNGASHVSLTPSATSLIFAEKIAETSETLQQSILALDKALSSTSMWNASDDASIATLTMPAWLRDGGGECVGIVVRHSEASSTIQLMPAGCLHPGAVIHNGSFLIVGGLLDASQPNALVAHTTLSSWICEGLGNRFEAALKAVRNIRVAGDWWLKLVDAHSAQLAAVESRDGVLVIERGTSLVNSQSPAINSPASAEPDLVLEFDSIHRCFQLSLRKSSLLFPKGLLRFDDNWIKNLLSHDADKRPVSETELTTEATVAKSTVASRYVLRMAPAPQRNAFSRQPTWGGTTLIVGDNPIARQLEARIRTAGLPVVRLAAHEDPTWLAGQLEELWRTSPVAHLFLTTPCDADAKITLDETRWRSRRNKGIMGNYWLCQRWLNRIIESKIADDASIVAVTSQGGDFGISGNLHSAEGGALAGLLKSILVESWMQGIRTLPIKIMDTNVNQSPSEVVENLWRELSIPSYDTEVAYQRGVRHVMRAVRKPMLRRIKPIPQGGTWVCTGGARGITAYVAEQLASRYQLKLHLLGKTEQQAIDPSWRGLNEDGLRQLRAEIMTTARNAGKNPVQTWQDTEKILEIDATLLRFKALGIEAYYHSCDVADRDSVRKVLDKVRSISGPIHGVLHGAGVGKDARFDRKQPEKVNQCIAAKVDGALALMEATEQDPLEYFVGFGSISGRFGANGHTDYSLANEMLTKEIDWLKHRRPNIKAVGFHWHAWGDVGMATKPETKLALEMIDMHFMPAAEGMQHLIAELEGDSDESEVLITDDRYYRMYYPGDSLDPGADRAASTGVRTPLLEIESTTANGSTRVFAADVDPGKDPFLVDHTLDRAPLLPFVVAAEMMIEGAAAHLATNEPIVLHDLEAVRALRFFSPTPRRLRVESSLVADGSVTCKLQSDFYSRDGRLIEANRINFRTQAAVSHNLESVRVWVQLPSASNWLPVSYPAADAQFHVGWPLQRLRKIALHEDGLVGKIAAPALIELAGTKRDLRGWRIPSAAMDACLFATGILAWQRVAPGTALPVRISRLEVGRLPSPGEACQVHVRLLTHSHDHARFDFTLYGVDGEMLLNAKDYEVAWLSRELDEHPKAVAGSLPR
ncbi:MAG: SDR family NAD(P)-dependent oxidoreductase [Pirellulaceae bacterium]|nr:SDR family NAD(P)-dependent oxidoreductase [Pirellulaceae bacterium]